MDGVKVDAEKVCNAMNFCLHGCTPLKVACPYYQEKPEGEDVCKDNLYHDAFDLISQLDKRCYELEKAIAGWEKYTGFLAAHGVLKEEKPDE